ncbi:MAG TPA: GAF domain-containing sensor histidine kinase, partial [Longimicrobiales bacterium]|nr:GAF domain-containing sensor histidine kinase [Longimicrobiales bacterium]
ARNAVTLPIMIGGESIGAVVVLSTAPTPTFGVEDIGILLEIATRASLAIAHARLFADLEKANREKAEFLAILSHELRTPLASAIGYSELLLAGIPEQLSSKSQEQVERIRACSWHQLSVVEQILRYARIDSGEDQAYIAEFDVPALLHEVKEIVQPAARERNMDIVWDVPAPPMPIRSDAGRLRQILVNLLSNAIKFTDEGAISLSVRRTDEEYYFVVSDTGIGISEDDTKHIFEPFWRAAQSAKMRGGSGLGLSVSMQLARSLNGSLSVQSQIGVGTTITLRLPIT